jgi:hypothetical protein
VPDGRINESARDADTEPMDDSELPELPKTRRGWSAAAALGTIATILLADLFWFLGPGSDASPRLVESAIAWSVLATLVVLMLLLAAWIRSSGVMSADRGPLPRTEGDPGPFRELPFGRAVRQSSAQWRQELRAGETTSAVGRHMLWLWLLFRAVRGGGGRVARSLVLVSYVPMAIAFALTALDQSTLFAEISSYVAMGAAWAGFIMSWHTPRDHRDIRAAIQARILCLPYPLGSIAIGLYVMATHATGSPA